MPGIVSSGGVGFEGPEAQLFNSRAVVARASIAMVFINVCLLGFTGDFTAMTHGSLARNFWGSFSNFATQGLQQNFTSWSP